MSASKEFKYYAFISYNHKDWKKAKKLQKELEHYRLPVVAREEIGEDLRIKPVFRYVENLPLGNLREEIKKELEASKYLIVICSPNSAYPNILGEHWVNDEVKRFIEIGRKEYIIPVIIDGEPNVGGERECFPPALRDAGIVGANLGKGRSKNESRNDFLKIVAKLLDLLPDQLIRHVDEEEAQMKRYRWLKRLPLVALSFVASLFVWDMLRPVTMYYADYVDCNGLPEGIYEVLKRDVRMRSSTYQFEYRGYYWRGIHEVSLPSGLFGIKRKLQRVSHIGPSFVPKSVEQEFRKKRPKIMEFAYDSDNRLMCITHRERGGRDFLSGPIVKKLHFENRREGDRLIPNGRMWETFDDGEFYFQTGNITQRNEMQDANARTRITHFDISRNSEGHMTAIRFLAAPDMLPTGDKDGVGGMEFILTDDLHGGVAGRVCEIRHLNINGNRCVDRYGVAIIKGRYKGSVISELEYLDIERGLVKGSEGYFRSTFIYDNWGNCTNQVLRNNRDEKVYRILDDKKKGTELPGTYHWAELRTVYSNGLMVARSAYDPNGKLVSSNGDIATVIVGYNDLGDEIYREFLNSKGERMITPEGCAVVRFGIDRTTGMRTSCRMYGKDGKTPCYDINNRVAGYDWTVDSKICRVIEQYNVDGDGKIMSDKDGAAGWSMCYDKKGRNQRWVSYDNATNECANGNLGGNVACVTWEYAGSLDGWDKCLYWQNSTREKRATDKDGKSGFVTRYDASGRMVECWDVDEKDVKKNGLKLWYRDFTAREEFVPGWWIEEGWKEVKRIWYIDENNISKDGGWIVKREIQDEFNRAVFTIHEDLDGNLVEDAKSGYAIQVNKWDRYGNLIERYYYNKEKMPVLESGSDTAGVVSTYDIETGKIRTEQYRDKDQRSPRKYKGEEYSEIRYSYPTNGMNRVVTTYWHKGDRVNCSEGYHKQIVDSLDSNDQLRMDEWYFDKEGSRTDRIFSNNFRYHHAHVEYDEWYNRIKVVRYDVYDEIMQPEGDGYCLKEFHYDALNRRRECLWVAKPVSGEKFPVYADNPGVDKDGVSRMTWEYFPNLRVASQLDEYGLTDAPCLYGITGAWHKVTMYDIRGRETNSCTYASDSTVICDANNIYKMNIAYFDDNAGRYERRDLYGKDIWGKTGVVHVVKWYNKKGEVVEQSYFGEGESLVGNKIGVSRFTREYFPNSNIYGRCDEFGVKEKPCLYGNKGVWHKVTMYDERGRDTNCCTYASDGRLICDADNVHTVNVTYFDDEVRNKRRDSYGEDIWGKTGVVHVVTWYNKKGEVVEQAYFGEGESLVGNKNGVSRFTREYFPNSNIYGRCDEFGVKEKPCLYGNKGVWHKVTMYDERGRTTNCCTYASDGRLICDASNVHTRNITYFDDEIRNERRDLYGKDIWGKTGVVHAVTWYDKTWKVVEEAYFGEGESSVGDKDGVVRFTREYFPDSNIYGRCDEFGVKEKPCLYGNKGVWHKVRMYDERGRDTNCCTYASDGRLICDANNVHTRNITYFDDEIRNKRRDLYGEDIGGVTGGVHVVTWYNKKGKVVDESYFGEGESSVGDNDGVVRFTREYFPNSNIYGRYDEFGVKEKPCLYGNKGVWHKVTMYDERGRDTNCCTYASDGRLICDANNVHTRNITYFDDEIRNERRDLYGEDIWGKTGVVHVVTWYNKKGKVVEQSYFGEGESSVGDNNGVVRFTREYFPDSNIYGRCDEFGVKEKPCLYGNKGVWHRVVMFNRDGNVTNVSNFAANSEPIADSNGMFSWSVTFPSNRVGAVERRDFYGKAIWGNDRLAHVVRYFDNKNRTVEECRFDAQGIPLPDKDGSVRILNEYVGDKKIISRRDEFGLEGGDGMYGFKGLIRLVSTYDTEDGDLIAMIGYDKNGKKRIFRHLILRFGEIVAGSNASSLGIKAGDILCKFNDVDLLAVSSLKELLGVLHGASENRRLVLARLKDNGAFSIFEVALPEGVIGAECLRRPVSDKQYFDLNTAVKQFSFNL